MKLKVSKKDIIVLAVMGVLFIAAIIIAVAV